VVEFIWSAVACRRFHLCQLAGTGIANFNAALLLERLTKSIKEWCRELQKHQPSVKKWRAWALPGNLRIKRDKHTHYKIRFC
jgi:hypothetical protein